MNPALGVLMVVRFLWAENNVTLLWSLFHCFEKVLQEQFLKSNGKLCQIYIEVPEIMLFPRLGSPLSRNKSQKCFMLSHNNNLNSTLNSPASD